MRVVGLLLLLALNQSTTAREAEQPASAGESLAAGDTAGETSSLFSPEKDSGWLCNICKEKVAKGKAGDACDEKECDSLTGWKKDACEAACALLDEVCEHTPQTCCEHADVPILGGKFCKKPKHSTAATADAEGGGSQAEFDFAAATDADAAEPRGGSGGKKKADLKTVSLAVFAGLACCAGVAHLHQSRKRKNTPQTDAEITMNPLA